MIASNTARARAAGWLLILEAGAFPTIAHAQAETATEAAETSESASSAVSPRGPAVLIIELDGYAIAPNQVQIAVSKELGIATVTEARNAEVRIFVQAKKGGDIVVTYEAEGSAPLLRAVSAPERDADVAEAVALLVGNLARNEAGPLLAELRKDQAALPKVEEPVLVDATEAEAMPTVAVNFSLFPPMTTYPNAHEARVTAELGLFYSDVGAIQAFALNPFVLRVRGFSQGAQVAGIASWNQGPGRGARLSGLLGIQQGSFDGAAVSGVMQLSHGGEGMSMAGIYNQSSAASLGGQVAGVVNVASDSFTGLSVAGLVNTVGGDMMGAQLAGGVNTSKALEGFQSAGVNVATGDVVGAQIGIVNIGGSVRGLQLGVVNVAQNVDGASVGVVTYSKEGRVQPTAWFSNLTPANVGLRFYTGPLYAMPTLGFGLEADPASDSDAEVATFAPGLSLGGRIPIERAFVDIDANYSNPSPEFRFNEHRIDLRYRALVGFEATSYLAPFGGGGVRHRLHTFGEFHESFDAEFLVGVQFL